MRLLIRICKERRVTGYDQRSCFIPDILYNIILYYIFIINNWWVLSVIYCSIYVLPFLSTNNTKVGPENASFKNIRGGGKTHALIIVKDSLYRGGGGGRGLVST
jgi:hypothetical protein